MADLHPDSPKPDHGKETPAEIDPEVQIGKALIQWGRRLPEYRDEKNPAEFAREMGMEISPTDKPQFDSAMKTMHLVATGMEPFMEVLRSWTALGPEEQKATTPLEFAQGMGLRTALESPHKFQAMFTEFMTVFKMMEGRRGNE